MGDISANFDIVEFKCKGDNCCDHTVALHPLLVDGLQRLRDKANVPLYVLSGFRCQRYNKEIKGSLGSFHTKGMAADIKSNIISPEKLAEIANTVHVFHQGAIGIYDSWIHVDVRENPARWDKRTKEK